MGRNAHEERGKSLRTLIIFVLVVGTIILISLSIKLFAVIKESKFDGGHRFTLGIHQPNKTIDVYSFDPKNKTVSILSVTGGTVQPQNLNQALATYVDGNISLKSDMPDKKPGELLLSLATKMNTIRTNVTVLDLLRLALVSNTISGNKITHKEIKLPAQEAEIDAIASQLFSDSDIIAEGVSVEIVNATGTPGVGRRLERMLNNAGADVIAVTTARNTSKNSTIAFSNEKTYTLEKIERILGIKAEELGRSGIADVKITLGEDALSSKAF